MRDGGANHNRPRARIHCSLRIGRRMHATLADNGLTREFRNSLSDQRHVGAVGHAAIDSSTRMRKRCRGDIAADGESVANVFDGRAVGHNKHALFFQRAHGIFQRFAIGARTIGSIDSDDIGASRDTRTSMTQGRRNVDAFMAFFPNANDGNLGASFNGGDVGKALAANATRTAQLARARHLCHGFGMAKRLAHIRLAAYDKLAFELFNNGIHCPSPNSSKYPADFPQLQ